MNPYLFCYVQFNVGSCVVVGQVSLGRIHFCNVLHQKENSVETSQPCLSKSPPDFWVGLGVEVEYVLLLDASGPGPICNIEHTHELHKLVIQNKNKITPNTIIVVLFL